MRNRCRNPNAAKWKHYGGRGITICPEWDDFEQFFADMGPKPTPRHSLDRIDNDGNYEPGNCRWATALEQRLNQQGLDRRSKTCRRGHEWTPENTVLYRNGYRTCRICRDLRMRAWWSSQFC